MKNKFVLFLLFHLMSITHAQELKFKNEPILIYDAKKQQPIIFQDDSLLVDPKTKKTKSFYKDDLPGNLSEYLFINVDKRNLFVHEGCGPVLEFKNDSLIRIDKSFLHRNQFLGNLFTYKNELYFLGGYGLFTHKKILTKYSFEKQEWDLIKTNDLNIPTFTDCFSKIIDDKLYVFLGHTNENDNHNLYILNLKTKNWNIFKLNFSNYLGKTKSNRKDVIENQSGFYFISNEFSYYIDFKSNLIKRFNNKYNILFTNSIIVQDTLYSITDTHQDKDYKFVYKEFYLKNYFENKNDYEIVGPIYFEDYSILYLKIGIGFVCLLLFGYFISKRKYWFLSFVHKTPFLYSIKNKNLFYKGKKVQLLNSYDILLLEKQLEHKNNFFALSDLNELFEDKKIEESMDVLIKRREKKLNNFIKTIAAVSGFNSDEICAFKKNEADKRIREIQILPKAITFIA